MRGRGKSTRGFIRVYAWIMILATLGALAAAGQVLNGSVIYKSTAEVVVKAQVTASGSFLNPVMPTEQRVVLSGRVAGSAAHRLGVDLGEALQNVEVAVPVDTTVLQITYASEDPQQAFLGASFFANEYVAYRNEKPKEPIAFVVTRASMPTEPESPDYVLVLGISVVGGLTIGFGAAYAWDRLSGRLRSLADVRRHTGLAILASLPRLPRPTRRRPRRFGLHPAFEQLVARVPGLLESRDEYAVLLTGAGPRQGTTTVASNLAARLARLGKKVVLISPAREGLPSELLAPGAGATALEVGLLGSLSGYELWDATVPGLQVLVPEEAADREVSLDDLNLLVRSMGADSLVVIDGPPAEQANVLAHVANRVVLVVDVAHGSRSGVEVASEYLSHLGDKLVGAVTTLPRRRFLAPRRQPVAVPQETPAEETEAAVEQPAGGRAIPSLKVLGPSRPTAEQGFAGLRIILAVALAATLTGAVAVAVGGGHPFLQRRDDQHLVKPDLPPKAGYFQTLPAGSWKDLPDDNECDARVHHSSWEPRPSNLEPNMTMPDPHDVATALAARPRGTPGTYSKQWNDWLLPRVSGAHTGTTDENIQWAACKWGLSDNLLRAIAAAESTWFQYLVDPTTGRCVEKRGCGDMVADVSPASRRFCAEVARHGIDYTEDYGPGVCPRTFSMMGVMAWQDPAWGRMEANQNGTFPFSRDSTAFALDYVASFLRGCQEGWMKWLDNTGDKTYEADKLWGCVGVWFAGSWHISDADEYSDRVRDLMKSRVWLDPEWDEAYQLPEGS